MCHIRPFVDLTAAVLIVSAPGMPDLILPLDYGGRIPVPDDTNGEKGETCGSRPSPYVNVVGDGVSVSGGDGSSGDPDTPMIVRVCGNRREGMTCTGSASAWFTRFLGVPCSLVRAVAAVDATATTVAGAGAAGAAGDATRSWASGSTAAPFADDGTVVRYRNGDGNGNGNGSGKGTGTGTGTGAFPGTSLSKEEENAGGGSTTIRVPWFQAGAWLGARRRASSSPSAAAPALATVTAGGGEVAANTRAFANEAPYLLISRASVAKVNDIIRRESGCTGAVNKVTNGGGGGGGDGDGGGDGACNGGEEDADFEQARTVCVYLPLVVV